MAQNMGPAIRFAFLYVLSLIFLLLLFPIDLSNHPEGTVLGILVFVVVFFFPGYLFLTLLTRLPGSLLALLSPVCGVASITTAYDIFERASIAGSFPYVVVVLSVAGMIVFALRARQIATGAWWARQRYDTVMAGGVVALTIAPFLWRSGRFSNGEFVFYGPAGHDPLYHVTLLQRLLHHVPPDNFVTMELKSNSLTYRP